MRDTAIGIVLLICLFCCFATPIPEQPTKLLSAVPDVRQCTDYSCGASALQAVLMYWGLEYREMSLMEMLQTTPAQGTHPDKILQVALDEGLVAQIKENLTLADLRQAIDQGIAPIILCQAWREGEDCKKPWSEVWESGHYMVLIGYSAQYLYFEDPSLLGTRGMIPIAEFLDRWHDYEGESPLDPSDRKYVHAAILIQGQKTNIQPAFTYVE